VGWGGCGGGGGGVGGGVWWGGGGCGIVGVEKRWPSSLPEARRQQRLCWGRDSAAAARWATEGENCKRRREGGGASLGKTIKSAVLRTMM